MRTRTLGLAAGLILALSLALPAAAQQGVLVGTVTDAETGAPIAQAQIQILGGGGSAGALSDEAGRYRAELPGGTYDLVVEILGYVGARFDNVGVPAGGTADHDIVLTSTVLALDELVVSASRAAPEKSTEAPATIRLISSVEIAERPTPVITDHLRSAPGVDVITAGVQSTHVVLRGFNNLFSGALHLLTDHRAASVPSLSVNLIHFIPTTDADIDRMEVVLGPGSALYGPNTADGVVHVLTKSPLESQGTSVTLGGGERSVQQGSFRSAFLLNENLGVKVSGQRLTGNDWEYVDPVEAAARAAADANPDFCLRDRSARGLDPATARLACDRLGRRDYSIKRWSLEARTDWRFAENGTLIGTYGRNTNTGIELTGLGAGQANAWVYEFYQARLNLGRFFAQTYLNRTNTGEGSYLLRDGTPLTDQSSLFVAQAQHGFSVFDETQDFTFGVDYYATRPESFATIYGTFDDDDDIDEWGVYLQSRTALSPRLELTLAGRFDHHSRLPDPVWSPRVALVFRPRESQSLRLTYNRAFSTPSSLNLFLDVSGGFAPAPLGQLGYSTRAFGTGPSGWSLQHPDGTLRGIRSPLNPAANGGPARLLPADPALLWPLALGALQAQGTIDAQTAGLLSTLSPTSEDVRLVLLNVANEQVSLASDAVLPDVPALRESRTESFELGWTGVFKERVAVSGDVYRTKRNDFVSTLLVQTPLVFLGGRDVGAFMVEPVGGAIASELIAGGMDPEAAQARASATVSELALAIGTLPLAVVSSEQVAAQGADLIGTYRNVGDITLWGADLSLQAFINGQWSAAGTYSWVQKQFFPLEDGTALALNAPKHKGTLEVTYRGLSSGLTTSLRGRFTGSFPAQSADFVGTRCIMGNEQGGGDCVERATLLDLTANYHVPNTRATLQLSVNNLLGTPYRSFVGTPEIGRFALLRVKYDLL